LLIRAIYALRQQKEHGDSTMSTKVKIALAAILVLAPISGVLANEGGEEKGGGPVQTWQDIARDAQDIQTQIKNQYHTGTAGSAYGYDAPAKRPTRHAPPAATQD
jgi:hypothetical protein